MILINWVQKGHTTLDPAGNREHRLSACWEQRPDNKANSMRAANEYAKSQNWVQYEILDIDKLAK